MTDSGPIRVGIMGFGQVGRQVYELASRSRDVQVVAIADIGRPDILHYLLCSKVEEPQRHQLQGNFLVNSNFRARLMQNDRPAEMPWDIFAVDIVIGATGNSHSSIYDAGFTGVTACGCTPGPGRLRRPSCPHVITK